jgi:hypothetical protein
MAAVQPPARPRVTRSPATGRSDVPTRTGERRAADPNGSAAVVSRSTPLGHSFGSAGQGSCERWRRGSGLLDRLEEFVLRHGRAPLDTRCLRLLVELALAGVASRIAERLA